MTDRVGGREQDPEGAALPSGPRQRRSPWDRAGADTPLAHVCRVRLPAAGLIHPLTETTMATKTTQEIEDLKREWCADPCWDIDTTEGFEAHRDELADYQAAKEAEWADAEQRQVTARARELRCSEEVVRYLEYLERRIARLEAT